MASNSFNRSRQHGRFPVDDLAFDLITILHEKSKGLEAYEQYLEDAREDNDVRELLEEIRDNDERFCDELQEQLHRVLMERGVGTGGQRNYSRGSERGGYASRGEPQRGMRGGQRGRRIA